MSVIFALHKTPLSLALYDMKLTYFILPLLLVGCSIFNSYERASTKIIGHSFPDVYCWSESGQKLDCQNELAQSDLNICIEELENKYVKPNNIDEGKEQLVDCMKVKGWNKAFKMRFID